MINLKSYNLFSNFRPYQEETINKILNAIENPGVDNIILNAPTGSGKSLIAYITSKYVKDNKSKFGLNEDYKTSYIITPLKTLMSQYEKEFTVTHRDNDITLIKGSENYKCILNRKSYKEGMCQSSNKKDNFPCKIKCPYLNARNLAYSKEIVISNFHYMLLEFDFVKKFGRRNLVILDEAHCIEKIILDYRSVILDKNLFELIEKIIDNIYSSSEFYFLEMRNTLENYINKYYENEDSRNEIKEIIKRFRADETFIKIRDELLKDKEIKYNTNELFKFRDILIILKTIISYFINDHTNGVLSVDELLEIEKKYNFDYFRKNLIKFTNNCCKISNFFKDIEKTEWVLDDSDENSIQLKPLSVEYLLNDALSRMGEKKIFMSATICGYDRFCKNLGLDKSKSIYIDVPDVFPIENKPFVYIPVDSMNSRAVQRNLENITYFVDSILDNHKNEKGIVHSVSYNSTEYLLKHLKNKNRVLIHNSENKDFILRQFYQSENKVLISPSILEGLDLKDDLSKFQIFIKVPYLNLGDKQIAEKTKRDNSWYSYQAVLSIIQGIGRSIRSENDTAVTYMLDKNFFNLFNNYKDFFPTDFEKRIIFP